MSIVRSFPPVSRPDARVLVLGSMPGKVSLEAVRYYAHPRNAFWPILAELCGFAGDDDYARRLEAMCARGVALWDVLQSCAREGSLDSDIRPESAQPNDFVAFLARHPRIVLVCCNGATAHRLFERRVRPQLSGAAAALPSTKLPSTSPAHAGMRFADKLAAWRAALLPHLL